MTIGVPSQLAPALFAEAFSRLLLVYSAMSVILAELLLVLLAINENSATLLWAALITGLPGLLLAWMLFRPITRVAAISYVVMLTAVFLLDVWVVAQAVPSQDLSSFLPFTFLGIALITSSGVGSRRKERILWASIGLLAAFVAMAGGAVLAGAPLSWDWLILAAYVLIAVSIFATPQLLRSSTMTQYKFDQAASEIMADQQRASFVKAQAATVHDTLLASLSVLSLAKPGPLGPALREDIERTLAQLTQGPLLNPKLSQTQGEADPQLSPLVDLLAHAESQGLKIHLNGEVRILEGVPCDTFDALSGALSQCLANVLQHSGQRSVEIVVLRSQGQISVTIIDGGKGFDPDQVPADRMGLKVSVFERMNKVGGSATVWSRPGNGAAIMLQIPEEVVV